MKIRKVRIFAIILCLLMAIPLASCGGSPDVLRVTLENKNGITVEGSFEDGVMLEAVEVVGEDKLVALQSIAEEKYDTEGKVYVYDISVIKGGAKIQPNGKVKVTISVPDIDTSKTYTVYHIKQDDTVEKINPIVQSGKFIFETDGFSCFIVAPNEEFGGEGENETTKKQVSVSINILPLAKCGMLKVNGTLYDNAASYKTTHTEGDIITVEAVATSGHHFDYWGEDKVLSRENIYEFTVGTENISFAANFTGHVVEYSQITDEEHTEKCKYNDYTATVAHTYVNERIITEATCQHPGEKELSCDCGKTITEDILIMDHNYKDGVCTMCGKTQIYVRVNSNGVENPNGAYIKMGKTYCEQVRDGTIINALSEIAGSPYMTEFENWTAFDFGNGDNKSTYYCDVEYEGLHYRGVCINDYRADNDNNQTTNRCWTGIYWFEQRDAMWQMVWEKGGKAYLISKNIWQCQRFAETDEGELTYENSWIRGWLQLWMDEMFTADQKAILQGNEDCFNDKIFLPSLDEISVSENKQFGLYEYPFCLGAFKDSTPGLGGIYCPYWLRNGIEKGEDGKNYIKCINSHAPFNETCEYLATKTFVGVVPAIIIEL
ncbi:MAG: hypothetical protein ACI4TX_04375 [Christensenellales bacterium]